MNTIEFVYYVIKNKNYLFLSLILLLMLKTNIIV